jgi:hypothetical protein
MSTFNTTKKSPRPRLVAAAIVTALVASTVAMAEEAAVEHMQVTKFIQTRLMDSDGVSLATDLCVERIQTHASQAQIACALAVHRARSASRDASVTMAYSNNAKRELALTLGNLAVAQALAGDNVAANSTMTEALSYAPAHPLLVANQHVMELRRIATSSASTMNAPK